MKKYLSILLSVLLLCTMLPLGAVSVSAATTGTYNGMTYEIADGKVIITGYTADLPAEVVIPETIDGYPVTTIAKKAFDQCALLTSIILPDSLVTIDLWAFQNCSALTSVTIPKNVRTIARLVFQGCSSLTAINVDEENEVYFSENGVLFSKYQSALKVCPQAMTGEYVIPNGVTAISEYAFRYCSGLTKVTIPDSVTSIENGAFNDCIGLTSVILHSGVTSIGNYAFQGCSNLTSFAIPESVTSISEFVFERCSSLTEITIPKSVTSIQMGAFNFCTGLTEVTIPESVTSINYYAFEGCSNLTEITLPKSVTSIANYAFRQCSKLTDVYYGGTEEDRVNIIIGISNDYLLNATWHYGCIAPEDHYSPEVDNSVMDTEDGSGLAYKFELKLNGLKAVQGNKVDFTNATVNYKGTICKVVAMGAVLSNVENKKMELSDVNGTNTIDVPVVYLQDLEPDSCQFAVRIINIPESALDRTIYARPYYVIETPDGDTVTVYGKISSASCAEYM